MDNQGEVEKEVELCVLCNEPTRYYTCDHVDTRMAYIEGMGQLCDICYPKESFMPFYSFVMGNYF